MLRCILDTEEASVSAPDAVPDPLVPPAPEPLETPPVPEPEVEDGARVVGAVVPDPTVDGARVVGAVVPDPVVEGARVVGAEVSDEVEGGVDTAVETAAVEAGVEDIGDDIEEDETDVPVADAGDAGDAPGFFCSNANPAAPRPPPLPNGATFAGIEGWIGSAPGGFGSPLSITPRPACGSWAGD